MYISFNRYFVRHTVIKYTRVIHTYIIIILFEKRFIKKKKREFLSLFESRKRNGLRVHFITATPSGDYFLVSSFWIRKRTQIALCVSTG